MKEVRNGGRNGAKIQRDSAEGVGQLQMRWKSFNGNKNAG